VHILVGGWQRRYGIVIQLFATLFVQSCLAGEVIMAAADHQDGHYLLSLDMRIHGKADAVYRVLTDYNHLHLINDSITSSKELDSKANVHRVRIIVRGCVWIFCRTVNQVQVITELSGGYIMFITDPTQSDLRYGHGLWQVIAEGSTTRIKYNADFVPAFWVPPILGPIFFKRTLLAEGQKTINGIERLLQQHQH
jgi:hypothetical protein